MNNNKRVFTTLTALLVLLFGASKVNAGLGAGQQHRLPHMYYGHAITRNQRPAKPSDYLSGTNLTPVKLPCNLPGLSVNIDASVDITKIDLGTFVCNWYPRMNHFANPTQVVWNFDYTGDYNFSSGTELLNGVPTGFTGIGEYPVSINDPNDDIYSSYLSHEMFFALYWPITAQPQDPATSEGLATAVPNLVRQLWHTQDPSIYAATSTYVASTLSNGYINMDGGGGNFYNNAGVDPTAAMAGPLEIIASQTADGTFKSILAAIGAKYVLSDMINAIASVVPSVNGIPTQIYLGRIPAETFNGIDGHFVGVTAVGGIYQYPYVNWADANTLASMNINSIVIESVTRTHDSQNYPEETSPAVLCGYAIRDWNGNIVQSGSATTNGGGVPVQVNSGAWPDGLYQASAWGLQSDGVTPDPTSNTAYSYFGVKVGANQGSNLGRWELSGSSFIFATPADPVHGWGKTQLTTNPPATNVTNGLYEIVNPPATVTATDGTFVRAFTTYKSPMTISTVNWFKDADGPNIMAAVNPASYAAGPLSPGSIVALFGYNLTANNISTASVVDNLLGFNGCGGNSANNQGTTTVYFVGNDGKHYNSPQFYCGLTQINAQVPVGLPMGQATVYAQVNNTVSTGIPVTIAPSSPGILVLIWPAHNADPNSGLGAITHLNGTIVAPDASIFSNASAAKPGETVVVYGVGLGATNPLPGTGVFSPSTQPAKTILPVNGSFNTAENVNPLFSGLTPGTVGLNQVNITIPMNASGPTTFVINVDNGDGTTSTSNTVTIPVQ